MKIKVSDFYVALQDFVPGNCFVVISVTPVYEYVDGNKTGKIIATKYTVADAKTYKNLEVKVNNPKALINNEMIESSEERFFVSFQNAVLHPYRIEYGNVLCSIVADSIQIIKS